MATLGDKMSMLHMTRGGKVVGFWYHPNRAAMEERLEQLKSDPLSLHDWPGSEEYEYEMVDYVRVTEPNEGARQS